MGMGTFSAGNPAARGWREHAWPLAILNVAAVLLAGHFLNNHLNDWGGDNIQFLLLAEALAKGFGYVNLQLAGHPVHAHYPPLYPVLLAPLVAVGSSLLTLKAWTALLSVAGLNVAYFYLVPFRGPLVAGLAVLASLCSEPFIDSGFSTMSDGPFVLFSFGALYLARRAFAVEGRWVRPALAAGFVTGLAILTRTVGVALVPAIAIYALTVKTPALPNLRARIARLALVGALVAVVASPWAITVSMKGWSRWSYLQELKGETRAATSPATPSGAGLTTAPAPRGDNGGSNRGLLPRVRPLYLAGGGLLVLLFACGAIRRRGLEDWYAAVYAVVLALWTPGGMRLLMPLFPILASEAYEALLFAGALLGRKSREPGVDAAPRVRLVFVTLVVGLIVVRVGTMLFVPISHERLSGHDAAWWSDYLKTACTLRMFAEPGDTVIAHPDNVPFYLAGIQSVRLRPGGGGNMMRALKQSGARFVIVTPFQHFLFGSAIEDAIDAAPDTFTRVVQSGTIEAFEIIRPGQPSARRHPVPPSERCDAMLMDATFR